MGPAAWAAIGRALGVAFLSSFFRGKNNVIKIVAREIQRSIIDNQLETAEALLRDMAFRHNEIFKEFINKFKNDLPVELMSKFTNYL